MDAGGGGGGGLVRRSTVTVAAPSRSEALKIPPASARSRHTAQAADPEVEQP